MMLSTDTVWNRRELEGEAISAGMFNMVIGLCLVWGFGLNYVMVQTLDAEVLLGINTWVFLIGYLVCVFAGTWIYSKSDNPAISFGGYTLVVIPLGLLLVRFLYFFDADVIGQAFLTTGFVTAAMMVAAMSFPRFFLSIGRALFIALLIAVVVEVGVLFFTGTMPPIFDWIFVLIFSGYIGYDWARAQSVPKTVDNAVDCAAALYVDIVILFIRLVRIFGRR
jgi:FtsH-binding integral membrane protein